MTAQLHLLGEPPQRAESSQWFTPAWLARRLASWIPPTARVIEPSAGSGNLVEPLIRRGHDPQLIIANELDSNWAFHLDQRFPGISVFNENFLLSPRFQKRDVADVVLMNPPFEENTHMHFVLRALQLAPVVVGVFPITFEYTVERDRLLWAQHGVVVRRAKLPDRVDYGGVNNGSFESEVLKIKRRSEPRHEDELVHVTEEVWRRPAA